MNRSPSGLHATSILRQMADAGMDADPYFEIVADTLLERHGRHALMFARDALERFRGTGDHEGAELWEGVWRMLTARVAIKADPVPALVH